MREKRTVKPPDGRRGGFLRVLLVGFLILFAALCINDCRSASKKMPSPAGAKDLSVTGDTAPLIPVALERSDKLAYSLFYDESTELPAVVFYELTASEATADDVSRSEDFREDRDISTGSAKLSDYRGSGYSRGHMAPAADFKWSEEAMSESFLLSNMVPQDQRNNAEEWMYAERFARWAAVTSKGGSVYIATGPVLSDGPYETIGESRVAVPKNLYKCILDPSSEKGIAFIVPNRNGDDDIEKYAVSIDEAERITGIDFFPFLDDETEERIESSFDWTSWIWDKDHEPSLRRENRENGLLERMMSLSGGSN